MTYDTDPTSRLTMTKECPRDGDSIATAISLRSIPPVRYPNQYVWFVFVSSLDLILTWTIVLLGGAEVNPIADAVLQYSGLGGMVAFKFCIVIFVIIMCEWTGRREPQTGFKLSEWAVAISAIPIVVAFVQLPMMV